MEDLRHHTLIHARYAMSDWDNAAQRVGLKTFERKADLVLDTDIAALRAAEQGLGLAMCLLPQGRSWLAQGRLVALFPPQPMPERHYFVFRRDDSRRAELMQVYEWVKARFAESLTPVPHAPMPPAIERVLATK